MCRGGGSSLDVHAAGLLLLQPYCCWRVPLVKPEGWLMASRTDDKRAAEIELVYRHLKCTLEGCRRQLDRIEKVLRTSKQDNAPLT